MSHFNTVFDGDCELDEDGNRVHVKHRSKRDAQADVDGRVILQQRDLLLKVHRLLVAGDTTQVLLLLEQHHRQVYVGDLYQRMLEMPS